ncbi:MAG: DotU family type IV/VI secretion system protein, partial [Gemmataceae bacterium]
MREEIGSLVQPIFEYGLKLRERLMHGQHPDFEEEQANLKTLLLTEIESKQLIDYGGESETGDEADLGQGSRQPGERFLGVRYALVCWLDEFFILSSPWETKWNERKLEVELYGTNDRAWKFWQQADLCLTRPTSDALEVFFLCVALGFRGERRDDLDELHEWMSSTKSRIAKIAGEDWPFPLEYEPPTYVPPHFGREPLQTMIFTG